MRRLIAVGACAVLVGCTPPQPGVTPSTPEETPEAPTTTQPVPPAQETVAPTADPDATLPTGEWSVLAPAPVPATEVAAAAFGGQVWVVGGFDASGNPLAVVQIYDPTFDEWSEGPALPEPIHHSALVSTGAELFLVGGYVGGGFSQPTAAVRRLDPAVGQWVDGPALPAARAAGGAAWDGERLVYGGGVGPDGLVDDVYVLDGSAWRRLGALTQARDHLAATSDGTGAVWFLGGRRLRLEENLGTVDLLTGETVQFLGELPTARGGVAAFSWAGLGGCLAGGEEPTSTFAAVECIDAAGTVTELPPLTLARHGLGAAVVGEVAYVVLGGPEPGLTVSDTVEAYRLP